MPRRSLPALGILLVVALGIPTISLLQQGPSFGGDTGRYVTGSEQLLTGDGLDVGMWPYLGYIAVVAASETLGAGLAGVVAFQLVLAAVALVATFLMGRSLAGWVGGCGAAVLLAMYADLHRWHAYVLTESLFVSWSVLLVWAAHRYVEERDRQWLLLVGVAGAASATTRPNGLLVLAVTLGWVVLQREKRGGLRLAWLAAVVVGVGALAHPTLRTGVSHSAPAAMMRGGYVLWLQDVWRHTMPTAPTAGDSLGDLTAYVAAHPIAAASLALHRIGAALVQARPYYPALRNVSLVVSVAVIYGTALVGVVVAWQRPLTRLLAAQIAVQLLFVGVTFADYDGRFGAYAIPWFAVLGGAGLSWILGRVQRSRAGVPAPAE